MRTYAQSADPSRQARPSSSSLWGPARHAAAQIPRKRIEAGPAGAASPRFGQDFSRISIHPPTTAAIQAKLEINTPGDAYEQEADRVAAQVVGMPEPRHDRPYGEIAPGGPARPAGQGLMRLHTRPAQPNGAGALAAPPVVQDVLHSSGRPLDPATRAFMEPRFGVDFSGVQVHTGTRAAESARAVNALAYTVGQDIVFGDGQFAPHTPKGRHLLAHELAHTVQQAQGLRRGVIQRYSGCTSTQDTTITDDHRRARAMLSTAIAAVRSYNGTTPAKVHDALARHFHGATSSAFAAWINVNLRFLWGVSWMAGYECYTGGILERGWACGPNDLATTFWCVPGVDIRLCPSYFGVSDTERSTTLIHEWVHKYGCNFDLGYEHEADYSGNWTLTQLLNADSFSSFIRDVQ